MAALTALIDDFAALAADAFLQGHLQVPEGIAQGAASEQIGAPVKAAHFNDEGKEGAR